MATPRPPDAARRENEAACLSCKRSFRNDGGIWQLFWPHGKVEGDVTEIVKKFYEKKKRRGKLPLLFGFRNLIN